MKKYFILSSILSTLLIGDCLAAQTVNESRAIGNLPVLAEVFQNKGGGSGISRRNQRISEIYFE